MWTLERINSEATTIRTANIHGSREMAQNIKSVDKQRLAIKNAATVPSGLTNQVSSLSTTCYSCGKSNHTASQCRYKDVDCLKCGKSSHLKAVCCCKGPMRH